MQDPSLNENLKKEIKLKVKEIEFWIFNNIDVGDSFTIFYAA